MSRINRTAIISPMSNKFVDLSRYDNSWYKSGGAIKRLAWMLVDAAVFNSYLPWPYSLKAALLRLFGAEVGAGAVIKPGARIKYPWFLKLGDHVWLGESSWIDNLGLVSVGNHVCVSQGAYILTGSHDYKSSAFDLLVKPVTLQDGVWIGAKAVVCPGVTCKSHSILAAGSVATADLEQYSIYQGNPAALKRKREIAA